MILEGETVLPDDHPVHPGFAYVCDGMLVSSDVEGTVLDLKRHTRAKEIRRCNLTKRMRWEAESSRTAGRDGGS